MKSHLAKVSLAVLSTVFLLGCQEPVGPEGSGIQAAKGGIPGPPGDGGGGGDKVAYQVDATVHNFCTANDPANWISTGSGSTGDNGLFVEWEGDALTVTPAGDDGYPLTDDAQMSPRTRKVGNVKKIVDVQLWIQDIAGPDGLLHSTDPIPVSIFEEPSPTGFTVHVHASGVEVWRHKNHLGGAREAMIGTICVGDMIFTPAS